jgi:hypothetical protein
VICCIETAKLSPSFLSLFSQVIWIILSSEATRPGPPAPEIASKRFFGELSRERALAWLYFIISLNALSLLFGDDFLVY